MLGVEQRAGTTNIFKESPEKKRADGRFIPSRVKIEIVHHKEGAFCTEALKDLAREGYYVAELRNIKMGSIEKHGGKFGSLWQNEDFRFTELKPSFLEVAIKLDEPIIPDSNFKTLDEHRKIIKEKFSSNVEGRIRGVEAGFLPVQDLIDLQYVVLHKEGINLFNVKNGINPVKIRTSTLIFDTKDEAKSLDVSSIHTTRGLSIAQASPYETRKNIFAPFILVPKKI